MAQQDYDYSGGPSGAGPTACQALGRCCPFPDPQNETRDLESADGLT